MTHSDAPERVVIFHDFSQALGGASYLVQVLIRELRARDVPLTFIAGDDGTNFSREDCEFIPLHGKALLERSKLGALTKGFYNRDALAATRDWIAANDTPRTVYHVHGWCKILTPSIFGALKGVSDRLVLHGHDYFNGCPNGAFFDYTVEQDCHRVPLSGDCLTCQCDKSSYAEKLWRSGREGLRRSLVGEAGTRAERLLMIHPDQRASFELGGWPSAKLHGVPNPVTPPLAERVTAEHNQSVLFIGRISKEKGADLAAAACAKAGVPITFVGDGAEMEAVRAVNPDAILLGRLDRDGVARELAKARLSVMPSRWSEPFGLVALEAVGSGVPVIVSDRALIAKGVAENGFGKALDTTDIDAFAAAIASLAEDDAGIEAMSRAGHERYSALCNSESSWADAILAHYAQVLSAKDQV